MAYSTIQKVREKAGLQDRYSDYQLTATGDSTIWLAEVQDTEKFVPAFATGNTSAGVSDIQVLYNDSAVGLSAIDVETGDLTLNTGIASGSSVTADFSSSPVADDRVIDAMEEAFSTINSYISKQYTLPISGTVGMLTMLETKLAAGFLLESSYGVSAKDLAEDGFRLQQEAMSTLMKLADGEIDLVANDGTKVVKKADAEGAQTDVSDSSARTKGNLFTPDNEDIEIYDPDNIIKEGI